MSIFHIYHPILGQTHISIYHTLAKALQTTLLIIYQQIIYKLYLLVS